MDNDLPGPESQPSFQTEGDLPQLTPEQQYFAKVLGRALARLWHYEQLPTGADSAGDIRPNRRRVSRH